MCALEQDDELEDFSLNYQAVPASQIPELFQQLGREIVQQSNSGKPELDPLTIIAIATFIWTVLRDCRQARLERLLRRVERHPHGLVATRATLAISSRLPQGQEQAAGYTLQRGVQLYRDQGRWSQLLAAARPA